MLCEYHHDVKSPSNFSHTPVYFCEQFFADEKANFNIQCNDFYKGFWKHFPDHYYTFCIDNSSSLSIHKPGIEISRVFDKNGKDHRRVLEIEALDIRNVSMKFLPTNLKIKLPKLKAIAIVNCDLKYILHGDMKHFGADLEYANFYGNKIAVLDGDLFEFNKNVRFMSFRQNPLKFIDPRFMENLKN